jgi:desulfoferrodoxin (superoxide reductase-like protein)
MNAAVSARPGSMPPDHHVKWIRLRIQSTPRTYKAVLRQSAPLDPAIVERVYRRCQPLHVRFGQEGGCDPG